MTLTNSGGLCTGMNAQSRSSKRKPDGSSPGQAPQGGGVGGRQGSQAPSLEGGEYQNSCGFFELPDLATTIADLKKMGLSPLWVAAAERIGIPAFLELWDLLDASLPPDDRRLRVPRLTTYQRFHRNRLIRSLEKEGYSASEIVDFLRENLSISGNRWQVMRARGEESSHLSQGVDGQAG